MIEILEKMITAYVNTGISNEDFDKLVQLISYISRLTGLTPCSSCFRPNEK